MSKSNDHSLDRRQFLAGGAATGVAATAAAAGSPVAAQVGLWALAPKAAVILHDPRIPMPPDVRRRIEANGTQMITLEGDPVWFWRSAAAAQVRDPATTLMGVTGWAELLVFRGLAAETRRHLRHEKLDAATGTFVWLVA
jgi:hypothetical protein